ncbi:hypothetical protein PG996_002289 [Apiospora saccharicola]|uniref:Uncharacterized protein n=1 Tax=Apiospora saccharicola TaxID=335842 RepID=A0ABR1WNA5_9PEZI
MSTDRDGSPPHEAVRNRRPSVTSTAFSNLFQRSGSTSQSTNGATAPISIGRDQNRRLSVTTIGLSGTGPAPATTPFATLRRGSISTNGSDSIDENAVEDDETSRTAPTTPFTRRMSFGAQAMRSMRTPGGTSPGSNGRPDLARCSSGGNVRPSLSTSAPLSAGRRNSSQASIVLHTRTPSDMRFSTRADQVYNWSEQLRSRAESSVSGARPSFASTGNGSPPRASNNFHDRAKSISDMPAPPQQAAAVKPKPPQRKPDAMQERILKGDFYMD